MHIIAILFVTFILAVWLAAAISLPFRYRRGPIWVRLLTLPAGFLLAVGAIGFFGTGLSAFGGMNWLPRSFQWPVGRAEGVISLPNGDHVVPLIPANRIQVYDRNWRFLRGWHVDASGGIFSLASSGQNRIDVFTARGSVHYVFTAEGDLVSRTANAPNAVPGPTQNGRSVLVPTRIWLWVFSGPFYSFAAIVPGMLLMMFIQMRIGGQTEGRRPVWRSPFGDEKVGSKLAARGPQKMAPAHLAVTPYRTDPPPAGIGRASFAKHGCLASTLVWTVGWVAVASLAVSRAIRSVEISSFVGGMVSSVMTLIGCLAILHVVKTGGRQQTTQPPVSESWQRRIVGWFAALVWCGVAVVWNVGIFGLLLREARAGHGWTLLLLLLWSLIGWFLLFVLFVGIGCAIDGLLRALRPMR